MSDIKIMLFSYVAFLMPIAVYCLILATVNRRINPVMVSGTWDALGLIFACGGALLVCGPGIIYVNFDRQGLHYLAGDEAPDDKKPGPAVAQPPAAEEDEGPAEPSWMALWYTVWASYYVLVLAGAALLMLQRRGQTAIYNVDPDIFHVVLAGVLDKLSLTHVRRGRSVFLGPRKAAEQPASTEFVAEKDALHLPLAVVSAASHDGQTGLLGQIDIEPFQAMRHITMHWRQVSVQLREEIEDELRRHLDECRCLENPAAGWFLGISSLLFFSVIAVAIMLVMSAVLPPRR